MDFNSYLPQAGQTFQFDFFSIIFAVILLITVIIYAKQGFLRALLNLVCSIGGFLLASAFCKQLGALLYNTGLGEKLYDPIFSWISGKGDVFNTPISQATADTYLPQAYAALGIPEFLYTVLNKLVASLGIIPQNGTITLSIAVSETISAYVFIGTAWLLISLVFALVCKLVLFCLRKVLKKLKVLWLDHFLGAIIGIAAGAFVAVFFAYILTVVLSLGTIGDTIKPMIAWEDSSVYTISKALCALSNDIASLFIK